MDYCMPKAFNFKTAMELGLIVPKNFLGKLECTRLLTREEASQWENYRMKKLSGISRHEMNLLCKQQRTL